MGFGCLQADLRRFFSLSVFEDLKKIKTFQALKGILVNINNFIALQFQWIEQIQLREYIGRYRCDHVVSQYKRIQAFETCERIVRELYTYWLKRYHNFNSPTKSPSLIIRILFSWISSFFKLSNIDKDFCGTAVNSLPPKFKRLSRLQERDGDEIQRVLFLSDCFHLKTYSLF